MISESEITKQAREYKGVAGWLLLLCLGLAVFGPMIALRNIMDDIPRVVEYYSKLPGYSIVKAIGIVLQVGVTCFSLYAGIALWSVMPNAVRVAKTYLVVSLIHTFVSILLLFMAGLPSQINFALVIVSIAASVSSVVLFAIWFTYLNRSKRVRATYQNS